MVLLDYSQVSTRQIVTGIALPVVVPAIPSEATDFEFQNRTKSCPANVRPQTSPSPTSIDSTLLNVALTSIEMKDVTVNVLL